jgi:hypothetical protein
MTAFLRNRLDYDYRILGRLLAGVLFLAAVAGTVGPRAYADQIVQESAFSGQKTNFEDSTSLRFDQFDSLGGTRSLGSVTIQIDQSLSTRVLIPTPPKGATVTVNIGSETVQPRLETSLNLGSGPQATEPMAQAITLLDPVQVSRTFGPGPPIDQTWTNTTTQLITITDPALLELFTGSGAFTFLSMGESWSRVHSSTGSGGALILTTADVRISLIYDFRSLQVNSVPEPSSLVLLTLGVLGVAACAGRRWRVA